MKHVFNFSSLGDSMRGTMLKLCLLGLTLIGGVIYPYKQTSRAMQWKTQVRKAHSSRKNAC